VKQHTKQNKKHLGTFRKFLVTHGISPAEGDISVFITFLGSIIIYIVVLLCVSVQKAFLLFVRKCRKLFLSAMKVSNTNIKINLVDIFKQIITNIYFRLFVFLDNRRTRRRVFKKRVRDFGMRKALLFWMSDTYDSIKNNAFKLKTAGNILLPVMSLIVLAFVVSGVTGESVGVSVVSGGTQIGVVSAEDVYVNAAKSFNAQINYRDAGTDSGQAFVTARLEITPTAADGVMDADTLADVMAERANIVMPEPPAEITAEDGTFGMAADGAEASNEASPAGFAPMSAPLEVESITGKIKAYAVMVEGEFLGAIDEPSKITAFLDDIRETGYDPAAIEIGFDKDIEYDYEQYFFPDQIVSENNIISRLSGTEKEAVFVTVREGDSPWSIASANNLSVDEILQCPAEYNGEPIDDISEFLPVGARIQLSEDVPYLNLLVTKPKTYERPVDYTVKQSYDDSMYKGQRKVIVKGTEGLERIEANVTYRGSKVVSREILSRTTVSDPVTQLELLGTKSPKTMVATGGGSGSYFWPVAGGKISAYMGDGRGHKGLDIAAPYGTNIYAAAEGTVSRAGNKFDGYGISVFVTGSDGNVTVYGHMSSLADISVGDVVVPGQLIGYVGSTGDSSGNHLHFEVRKNGVYKNPLDYVSQR
jgi:murein DD-endopeptidase MepM/ murein hydrolase activator NlpD